MLSATVKVDAADGLTCSVYNRAKAAEMVSCKDTGGPGAGYRHELSPRPGASSLSQTVSIFCCLRGVVSGGLTYAQPA
jgi:hypothetical protein